MAASIPFPFNPQIPVTPPPDQASFTKGPPLSPDLLKVFAQQAYGPMGAKPGEAADKLSKTSVPSATENPTQPHGPSGGGLDPRYLAMASRIAAYYQQRCQAVARYQQHRCQVWANTHRQKCQETMQAAMLVVAWYVRDRIQRRRRRQRRQFRGGLSARRSRPTAAKGQSVRRWIMGVPKDVLSASEPFGGKFADQEENDFSIDKESTPDKDSKLFDVADNLIKSQLSRIDVPLMGTLSFDESDSETEAESGSRGDYDDEMAEEYDDDGEDSEMAEDDDYDDDGDLEGDDNIGSQEVQIGTGKGSRKRTRSSVS
ncbi:hypothetical protein QBC33DRAFT_329036 [Phialemonium atrogriseum]|uniref:Uncharacterized protein n=1 Tax=Phialemonium atrogriseum TaxID=1093897 RepID=A0AAJ0C528_9PEZI|nr:uncharacterized protein QBC33DRAFT_329036 [Phialemonium atrogriseum]KAK1769637.1 hypothetical protein QBC33DRAFT_329036 [Phialemonium atrogriseum]